MDEREIGTDPSPVPTQVSSGQGRYRTGLSEKGPSAPQSRYRPAQPRCWRLRPRLWGGRTGPGETGTEAPAPGEGAAGPAPARGMAEPQTQREAPRGSGLKRTAEPADAGTARAGPGPTAEEDERGLAREGRLPPPRSRPAEPGPAAAALTSESLRGGRPRSRALPGGAAPPRALLLPGSGPAPPTPPPPPGSMSAALHRAELSRGLTPPSRGSGRESRGSAAAMLGVAPGGVAPVFRATAMWIRPPVSPPRRGGRVTAQRRPPPAATDSAAPGRAASSAPAPPS